MPHKSKKIRILIQIKLLRFISMIKSFLITDSQSFPYYSRSMNNFGEVDIKLFSGLICATGRMGQNLFDKNLATIHFGEGQAQSHLVIITKTIFSEKRVIYFAFFIEGDCNLAFLREIASNIYIEIKSQIRGNSLDLTRLRDKVDNIIENKYAELSFCVDSGPSNVTILV